MVRFRFQGLLVFLLGLLWCVPGLRGEESSRVFPAAGEPAEVLDPAALIGLTLEGLLGRYGIPQSVYAVRGLEPWQDDVVFVYAEGDFYLYRDRVWQVGFKAAYGVKTGDPRGIIPLVLGEGLEEFEDHILCPLFGWSWPLMLRFNINGSGAVSAVYIYRSDF